MAKHSNRQNTATGLRPPNRNEIRWKSTVVGQKCRCVPSEGVLSAVALNFGQPHLVMCEKKNS